jgi:dUTP pyrophosphatase
MFPVTLKFIMTHDSAVLPKYNHDDPYTGDSGLDVTAVEDVTIPYRGKGVIEGTGIISEPWAVVPVGLKLAYITPGYWLRVEGRSGMGFKKHIFPHFGIIDNQYRGGLGVKLYNLTSTDYQIKAGDKVAQIVGYKLIEMNIEFTDTKSDSTRGEKGFGSSGR